MSAPANNPVLMIVTSHDKLGDTGQPAGIWLEELAASYYVLVDGGYDVSIGSPKGGKAPLDPASLEEPWLTAVGCQFLADKTAMTKLERSKSLTDVKATDYCGIFLVGGVGTVWDFTDNARLTALVENIHNAGQPVAAICHGVLGLAAAKGTDGKALVKGKAVTGISNAEEAMTGYDQVVPVLPESRLRELGGNYTCAEPLGAHVVTDGHLLTGQNPASAAPLAEALLKKLQS